MLLAAYTDNYADTNAFASEPGIRVLVVRAGLRDPFSAAVWLTLRQNKKAA
jgi:hypothetical protein